VLDAVRRSWVSSRIGRVDNMVNNTGIEHAPDPRHWRGTVRRVMAISLKGALFGTQIAAKPMIKQGGGRIINISSVHEDWPMPGNPAHCCRKAACACSRAPRAWNSPNTTSLLSARAQAQLRR
jgi:glucose 1-dehydrogenase